LGNYRPRRVDGAQDADASRQFLEAFDRRLGVEVDRLGPQLARLGQAVR
jgi:hypothetical protein